MNESAYLSLLRTLGFTPTAKRALLKHQKGLPSIYFNVDREGAVYFTVRSAHYAAFSKDLWSVIGPRQKKDNTPQLMTLVPVAGHEKAALASIIGWRAPDRR